MAGTRSSGFENINGAGSGAVGSFGFFDFCEFVRVSFFLFFFETRFFEEEKDAMDRLNSFNLSNLKNVALCFSGKIFDETNSIDEITFNISFYNYDFVIEKFYEI